MHRLIRSPNVAGLFILLTMGVAGLTYADHLEFEGKLSGAQEETPVVTPGKGRIVATFHQAYRKVNVDLTFNDLVGTVTAVHFHCARPGANGPVAFGLLSPGPLALDGNRIRGTLSNSDFNGGDCVGPVGRPVNNIAALAFAMQDGLIYINVHTSAVPSGEIRAQIVATHDDSTPNP